VENGNNKIVVLFFLRNWAGSMKLSRQTKSAGPSWAGADYDEPSRAEQQIEPRRTDRDRIDPDDGDNASRWEQKDSAAAMTRSKQDSAAARSKQNSVVGPGRSRTRQRRPWLDGRWRPPKEEDGGLLQAKTDAGNGARRWRLDPDGREEADATEAEEEADGWWVESARDQLGIVKRTLTLKISSIYHSMNNTCIYLKDKSLNIYIYRRREYKKNFLKKYNNKKN
jgi:hypothetical protein